MTQHSTTFISDQTRNLEVTMNANTLDRTAGHHPQIASEVRRVCAASS